ncbi:hypothetical protein CELL_01788 [Cellulomonas sp. T2.31MG-18]|uniref:MaoC/PaaZ C-terminal domain-containing protein n=1 Tax=Cellulomonas sp. T2.31MG-18 TaxID=3157619 RepID=UPI0035E5E0D4
MTGPLRTVELPTVPPLGDSYRHALTAAAAGAVSRRAGRAGRGDATTTLPDVTLSAHGVQADAERLTAYQHLLGEPGTDVLPAGFVHVLAYPVATALMVRDDFPLPLLGLVHLANRVEQRRPLRLGQELDVRSWATGLRAHRSGTQVDLVSEVAADGVTAWRGVSTYLAKGVRLAGSAGPAAEPGSVPASAHDDGSGGGSGEGSGTDEATDRRPFEPPVPTATWRLPADTGRRYAAVSGDVNPIHLWAPAARAFGFHGAIAHGMFTAARALATVGAVRGESFTWSVDFAAPVVLPTTVAVRVARSDPAAGTSSGTGTGHDLTVWDPRRRRPHLTGSVVPLPTA